MSHLYTRLFIARAAGCKWNSGDFAVKWEWRREVIDS